MKDFLARKIVFQSFSIAGFKNTKWQQAMTCDINHEHEPLLASCGHVSSTALRCSKAAMSGSTRPTNHVLKLTPDAPSE